MAIQVFRSTDVGAPVLDNVTPGRLLDLLDFCLVAGSGWTRPFYDGAASVGVYRAPAGKRRFLRVEDPATGSVRYGRVRGFTDMSDINTGVGMFPNVHQNPTHPYWYLSQNTAGTGRPWICIAGQTAFYLFVGSGVSNKDSFPTAEGSAVWYGVFFGDYKPVVAGGPADAMLLAEASASTYGVFASIYSNSTNARHTPTNPVTGLQSAVSLLFGGTGMAYACSNGMLGGMRSNAVADPVRAGIPLTQVTLHTRVTSDPAYNVVGVMPGLFAPFIQPALWDTFTLSDGSGRSFLIVPAAGVSGSTGRVVFETTPGQDW